MRQSTFFKNITFKRAAIITGLYLVGAILMLMAMTDIFTRFEFEKKYSFLLIILIADTFLVWRMWYMYYKNKKNRE